MKSGTTAGFSRAALCAASLVLMSGLAVAPIRAQDVVAAAPTQTQAPGEAKLSEGQLDQLVAPIALYPDPLLIQVLMASTYPLEVVEAARWSHDNSMMKGPALQDAMQTQSWDPSVKALTAVPQTLQMMNDKLDWTQQLGDTFLAQQQDVLDAVQRLRAEATAAGNLQSTPQQLVTTQTPAANSATVNSRQPIVIKPVDPDFYYVPVYDPAVAYGAWSYPAYPPFYWSPPGFVASNVVSFAAGVAVGAAIWGGCDWWHNNVIVNVNRFNVFNHTNINVANDTWIHNPEHRHGVPYSNAGVARRFGSADETAARDTFSDRSGGEHNNMFADRPTDKRPDAVHGMAGDRGEAANRSASATLDRHDEDVDRRADRMMPERGEFAPSRVDANLQAMRPRAQAFRPNRPVVGGGFHGFGGGRHQP